MLVFRQAFPLCARVMKESREHAVTCYILFVVCSVGTPS